jgi:hypothetical protein
MHGAQRSRPPAGGAGVLKKRGSELMEVNLFCFGEPVVENLNNIITLAIADTEFVHVVADQISPENFSAPEIINRHGSRRVRPIVDIYIGAAGMNLN